MANVIRQHENHPQDLSKVLKDVTSTYGTDQYGNPTYAQVVALEPNSIGGGGGGSGTSMVDEAAFTEGTTPFTPSGGYFKTAPTALTTGQGGTVALTAHRAFMVNLQTAAGAEIGVAAAPVRVDPTGTTTQPVSGTVTANVGTTNGLALDATLTGGTQKTKIVDSGGSNVATVSAAGAVKVDGSAVTQPVSGTFWQATQPVSGTVTANQGGAPWAATPQGQASTGATTARLASSAATTNATSTKASAGTLYGVHVLNTNAAVRYVHFYDKASAPTVGTDTPIITIPVPPSNGGIVRTWVTGAKFASGIAYAMTTDAAAGNNAVASGDLVGLHFDYV